MQHCLNPESSSNLMRQYRACLVDSQACDVILSLILLHHVYNPSRSCLLYFLRHPYIPTLYMNFSFTCTIYHLALNKTYTSPVPSVAEHAHTHAHAQTHTHTHTHAHSLTRTHTHMCKCSINHMLTCCVCITWYLVPDWGPAL